MEQPPVGAAAVEGDGVVQGADQAVDCSGRVENRAGLICGLRALTTGQGYEEQQTDVAQDGVSDCRRHALGSWRSCDLYVTVHVDASDEAVIPIRVGSCWPDNRAVFRDKEKRMLIQRVLLTMITF